MKFLVRTIEPETKGTESLEVVVEATSYANAAKAHIACDGPRLCLLTGEARVEVRRLSRTRPSRDFVVRVRLTVEESR